MQQASHRWYSVEYLRAVAAIGVALFHFEAHLKIVLGLGADTTGFLEWFGFAGVDLFFIISGFVIWPAAWQEDNGAADNRVFLLRRLVRVFVPYWAVVVLACVARVEQPGADVLKSLLLFPQPVAAQVLPVAWTLVIEMAFYATVFGLLFLQQKNRFKALCVVAGIALAGNVLPVLTGLFDPTRIYWAWTWVPTVGWFDAAFAKYVFSLNFCEFVMGAWLANLARSGGLDWLARRYGMLWCIALAWFFVAVFAAAFWIGRIGVLDTRMALLKFAVIMAGATLIFTAAICTEIRRRSTQASVRVNAALLYLGRGSYMIYILHTVMLGLVDRAGLRAWCASAGVEGALVFALSYTVMIWVAAWIGNRIELPVYRRLIALIPARVPRLDVQGRA